MRLLQLFYKCNVLNESALLRCLVLRFWEIVSNCNECSETEYWIELLLESGYYNNKSLLDSCTEVKRILISSINTVKKNMK